jgi:phage protein D
MGIPTYKITFDQQAASDDIYENLIRLEIEDNIRKAANFMLRIGISLQGSGEWTYLDDDRFRLLTRVGISIGFEEGSAAAVFDGYITHVAPHFDPQEELCYLEIRGMDATCLMNLEEKLVTWVDKSHSDIATEIFNSYGITPDVEDSPVTHVADGNMLVQRGTDIRFLKELALRNGFECYVTADDTGNVKGCFKPLALNGSPLPPLAVQFEDETNVQFIDLQVTAIQPLSSAGWHLGIEDKTVDQVVSDSYTATLLGKESLIDVVKNKVDQLSIPVEGGSRSYRGDKVFLDSTELENTLKGDENQNGWFIKARGCANGDQYGAAIRARCIVPVKGIGTRYSGNYLASSVKHIFSSGEYEQHMELIRNARGLTGNESFAGAA